jgi:hypothetical protein
MQNIARPTVSLPRVTHRDRDVVVAQVDNLCVVIWRGGVNRSAFEKQREGLASVVDQHPKKSGFLCIIEQGTKPPDDELRRASAEMVKAHAERLRCVACVIEGEGFRAAITRGALTGIMLLIRSSNPPIKFFSTITAAASWMHASVDMPSVDALSAIVAELRSRFPPNPK